MWIDQTVRTGFSNLQKCVLKPPEQWGLTLMLYIAVAFEALPAPSVRGTALPAVHAAMRTFQSAMMPARVCVHNGTSARMAPRCGSTAAAAGGNYIPFRQTKAGAVHAASSVRSCLPYAACR